MEGFSNSQHLFTVTVEYEGRTANEIPSENWGKPGCIKKTRERGTRCLFRN